MDGYSIIVPLRSLHIFSIFVLCVEIVTIFALKMVTIGAAYCRYICIVCGNCGACAIFGTALYFACEFVRLLVCPFVSLFASICFLNRLLKIPWMCSEFINYY